MATNWVDEVLSGATSTGSKTLSLATGNALSVANSSSESIFTVTSDTTNGGYTSILGIEGQEAVLFLGADNADDAGDAWEIHSDTSGNFKIGNRTSGTGSPTRSNTFTNALTIDSSRNITVGVDGTGYDVKFFGDTSSAYMLWDQSADDLILSGTAQLSIDTTTDASSTTTGSFHTDGGVGIAKKLYVGTNAFITGDLTVTGNDIKGSGGTAITMDGSNNVTIAGDLTVSGGNITNAITCDSTVTTAGLLTATSGVKLGNNIIYASDGNATITLDTSDNTTFTNDIVLADTKKLRLDGSTSGDTYIMQNGADVLDIVVGGDTMMKFTEAGNETIAVSAENFNLGGSDSFTPKINLECATDDEYMGIIQFKKTVRTGQDGDLIGRVIHTALNDADEDTTFAYMQAYITDASNGTEKGKIRFNVASGTDGGVDTVLTLEGTTTDGKPACQVEGYFSANGATPAAAPNYTVSNLSTDRALDCDSTSDAEVADVLGQVITDLIAIGIFQ